MLTLPHREVVVSAKVRPHTNPDDVPEHPYSLRNELHCALLHVVQNHRNLSDRTPQFSRQEKNFYIERKAVQLGMTEDGLSYFGSKTF